MSERSPELQSDIRVAIQCLRSQIQWKPGKDRKHLETRIGYGHLPPTATIEEYESIITAIVNDRTTTVYVYVWPTAAYVAVVGIHHNEHWLVMFSMEGIMETAFPPTDIDEYLSDSRFQYVGRIQELFQ